MGNKLLVREIVNEAEQLGVSEVELLQMIKAANKGRGKSDECGVVQ